MRTTDTSPAFSYLALREVVLTRGIDALPLRNDSGSVEQLRPAATARELLKEFLPDSAKTVPTNGHNRWLPESMIQLNDQKGRLATV